MHVLSAMLVVWSVVLAAFVALMVYRGHLNIHETDQLFLSENSDETLIEEQNAVIRRATLIQPICNGLGGAAALISVLIVGIYIVQQIPNMRF